MAKKCVHHYHIDPPEGETSIGVCIKCKKKQKFLNVVDLPPTAGYVIPARDPVFWNEPTWERKFN